MHTLTLQAARSLRKQDCAQATPLPKTPATYPQPMDHPFLPHTDNEPTAAPLDARPFLVEHLHPEARGDGSPRPGARLVLDRSLRTSGLLQALPAEDLKNLILLLTYLHPNGGCSPTIPELAHDMRVSPRKVRSRMQRLTAFAWRDAPLVLEIRRESGLDSFAPSPHILEHLPAAPIPSAIQTEAPLRVIDRDAVIAASRALYSRPRAQVEREIAEQMGWPDPTMMEDDIAPTSEVTEQQTGHSRLYARLARYGLRSAQIDDLLDRYDARSIQQQLDWLPFRNAQRPDRLIVAAIENDYEAPLAIRKRTPDGEQQAPSNHEP